MKDKSSKLFVILAGFFIANALLAEFIGVKIFSVEKTLGLTPLDLELFGEKGLGFNMTAGVLLWPVVFVFTDVLNEYFGKRGVRFLSLLTVALISYGFVMLWVAIKVSPADFWIGSQSENGIGDMDRAFTAVFGQGMRIIIGSIAAFFIGQLVDVWVFQKIKAWTGEGKLWLRATGSTIISQFIDSYVVLFIAFYGQFSEGFILAIGLVAYMYKFCVAIVSTPVIYLVHYLIERYLGKAEAKALAHQAR